MTMDPNSVARLYLKGQTGDMVVLNLPGTNYMLHLRTAGPLVASPQGRVRGVVRLPVWKLDVVTAGGAFIEPVIGRPRRVQGNLVGVLPSSNAVIVELFGQPIVGELPPRWSAAELIVGTRVGLDVKEGGVFEPAPVAAHEPDSRGVMPVNLGV